MTLAGKRRGSEGQRGTVHSRGSLEGDIQKAITYYEDPHELLGKADYVMANPPFNVDEIDADKVKNDPRLPFGLPGVNKMGPSDARHSDVHHYGIPLRYARRFSSGNRSMA
jgi:hypothetical protein